MNYTRPSLAFILEPIKKAFLDAKGRGVKLRYLTEITHDNIGACKELMTLVDELRHLDGIKGNFMISETEYLAPVILFEKGKIASQIICSNVKEILDQHQYMFDTLWSKSISAQQRIRQIEEGIISYETKVIEEEEKKTKRFREYLENSNQLLVCTQDNRLQFVYNNFFKVIEKILDKSKNGEHKGIRWLTSIKDKDSANLAKIFLDDGVVIRHINQIPINFGVSDKEVVGSITNTEGTEMAKTLFVSNEPLYVEHFNSLFEELWKNGIDAEDRIRDIEVGAEWADVEVIPMSSRARDLYLNLVNKAENEIIIMFLTTNAFIRQKNLGVIQFSEEAARKRDVKVRILMPSHKSTEDIVQHLKENYAESIDIRYIEKTSDTKATILVVDRKVSLVMELRDDSKRTFDEAIGLSTYSNSKAGVLSYVAIFEKLWQQTELYQKVKETNEQLAKANEELKQASRIKDDFINVAAHELRNPVQPILGLAQILRSRKMRSDASHNNSLTIDEEFKLLDIIVRNAKKLLLLEENILDVARIENKSLKLDIEECNLYDVIASVVQDTRDQIDNSRVELLYKKGEDGILMVLVDKSRLEQVLSNLLR